MPIALFLLCDAALLVLGVVAVLLRRRSAATAVVYGVALVLSLALLAGALVQMVGQLLRRPSSCRSACLGSAQIFGSTPCRRFFLL